jgi:hypothetical protein
VWQSELGTVLSHLPSRLKLVTAHLYPLMNCSANAHPLLSQLLSPSSIQGLATSAHRMVKAAAAHGKPLRVDEINGITCGGYRGVSDTFASALWVLDVLFELDKIGVDGVNVQTVPGGVQEIFGPVAGDGGSMVVHPEFYGMMMFAQASPAGSRLFTIPARLPANVKLWATRAKDRSARVTLINDNLSKPRTVHVPLSSPGGPAAVEALRAPHVGSTSGVTLGGRSFGNATSTGLLPAPVPRQLKSRHGGYTVRLPPATAILLTVPASATQSPSSESASTD